MSFQSNQKTFYAVKENLESNRNPLVIYRYKTNPKFQKNSLKFRPFKEC